ncbi:peptide ABC transporter substrate-binding protein [Spirochaetia bacterium 38H-sp]|uniref:Peptide ABC transporter substrate-binding protein n=1 Tax=Rarispira pelagica TaxID=3141764 RepID=A0ABU9U8Q7_9SPIR
MRKIQYAIALLILSLSITLLGAEEKVFSANITPFPDNLNPQRIDRVNEANIAIALYEGLVSYSPADLKPLPGVAYKWEWNNGYTEIRFFIRDNAFFSDGSPVTAEDFKRSWLYMIREGLTYASLLDVIEGAKEYREKKVDDSQVKITAESDKVLFLKLKHPAPYILSFLGHQAFVPINSKMDISKKWQPSKEIICNGPYMIETIEKEKIIMKKNPYYWDKEYPKIEKLIITSYEDRDKVMRLFNGDVIHWAPDGIDVSQLANRKALIINPLFSTTFYFFDARMEPWNNPDVRKALALLVDWSDARNPQKYFFPTATLVPSIPGYPEIEGITKQDKTKAMELLEKAGYAGGKGLPEMIIYCMEGTEEEFQQFTKVWKDEIGLKVTIKSFSTMKDFFSAIEQGGYSLSSITWLGDFPDPMTFLSLWQSTSGLNYAHYSSEEYDKLIEEANKKIGTERLSMLAEAEKFLLEKDVIVLPISNSPAINLIDLDWIDGWYPNPLDLHPFKYIDFMESTDEQGVIKYNLSNMSGAESRNRIYF